MSRMIDSFMNELRKVRSMRDAWMLIHSIRGEEGEEII